MLQVCSELDGLIKVDEVARGVEQVELRSGDRGGEAVGAVDGDPSVLAAPDHKHGRSRPAYSGSISSV